MEEFSNTRYIGMIENDRPNLNMKKKVKVEKKITFTICCLQPSTINTSGITLPNYKKKSINWFGNLSITQSLRDFFFMDFQFPAGCLLSYSSVHTMSNLISYSPNTRMNSQSRYSGVTFKYWAEKNLYCSPIKEATKPIFNGSLVFSSMLSTKPTFYYFQENISTIFVTRIIAKWLRPIHVNLIEQKSLLKSNIRVLFHKQMCLDSGKQQHFSMRLNWNSNTIQKMYSSLLSAFIFFSLFQLTLDRCIDGYK